MEIKDPKGNTRKMTRSRSPHHRVAYANQTQITVTAVDVRLRFGCIERVSDEEIHVEDQVDVILGPAEMNGLYQLLGKYLPRFNKVEEVKTEIHEEKKGSTPAKTS